MLTLPARRGSAIFFDLRVRHRGGPHRGEAPRAVLYLGYVREWFCDAVNFHGKQSAAWDELPTQQTRKLLSRIDARSYVQQLEQRLRELGVDVSALQAKLR